MIAASVVECRPKGDHLFEKRIKPGGGGRPPG